MAVSGWISKALLVLIPCFCFAKGYAPTDQIQNKVAPYLIPSDHPAKIALDKIFSKPNILVSEKTLKAAGFENPVPRKFTRLIVTSHPTLPGYILKTYVDAQQYYKDKPEYNWWIARIKGAALARKEIEKRNLQDQFKVPQKWIYALPGTYKPNTSLYPKYFLLIEEDMDLYATKSNEEMWEKVNDKEFLLNVFQLLESTGLHDCAKPDNIPFSKDGKIAFIDTQTYHEWPVDYSKMTKFLSKDMQSYWKELISNSKK